MLFRGIERASRRIDLQEGVFNPRERLRDFLEQVDEQKLDVSISDRQREGLNSIVLFSACSFTLFVNVHYFTRYWL